MAKTLALRAFLGEDIAHTLKLGTLCQEVTLADYTFNAQLFQGSRVAVATITEIPADELATPPIAESLKIEFDREDVEVFHTGSAQVAVYATDDATNKRSCIAHGNIVLSGFRRC